MGIKKKSGFPKMNAPGKLQALPAINLNNTISNQIEPFRETSFMTAPLDQTRLSLPDTTIKQLDMNCGFGPFAPAETTRKKQK